MDFEDSGGGKELIRKSLTDEWFIRTTSPGSPYTSKWRRASQLLPDHIIPFPEWGGWREPPPPPSHAPDRDLHRPRGLPGKPVPEADSGGVTPPPKIPAVGGSMRFENFTEGGLAGNPPSQK
jgi:hypothetical protein